MPRRMTVPIVPRREKAAERYPANHCRKNKPKLRVNSRINSHVVLHGRPWQSSFQPLRKLHLIAAMQCRRVRAQIALNAIVVNAGGSLGRALECTELGPKRVTLHLSVDIQRE